MLGIASTVIILRQIEGIINKSYKEIFFLLERKGEEILKRRLIPKPAGRLQKK